MKLTILSVLISLLPLIACHACEPGYYWSSVLGTNEGCHKCFCSGVTDKCHGGSFYKDIVVTDVSEIRGFLDWPNRPAEPLIYDPDDEKLVYFSNDNDANAAFIWEIPFKFYKTRTRTYGGLLQLMQEVQPPNRGTPPIFIRIPSSEVNISFIVESNGGTGDSSLYAVALSENRAYIDEDWSQRATKAEVMRALLLANKILVFTDLGEKGYIAIRSVRLSVAVNEDHGTSFGVRPDWIEVCDCPKGYSGDSCESCAEEFREPCKDIEPCEDQCNDYGICLGCPQCEFEYTPTYYRNINNKTESVFGACEPGDPKWLTN